MLYPVTFYLCDTYHEDYQHLLQNSFETAHGVD